MSGRGWVEDEKEGEVGKVGGVREWEVGGGNSSGRYTRSTTWHRQCKPKSLRPRNELVRPINLQVPSVRDGAGQTDGGLAPPTSGPTRPHPVPARAGGTHLIPTDRPTPDPPLTPTTPPNEPPLNT